MSKFSYTLSAYGKTIVHEIYRCFYRFQPVEVVYQATAQKEIILLTNYTSTTILENLVA